MAPRGKNKGGGYKSGKTPAKVLMPDVLHLLLLGVTREHAQGESRLPNHAPRDSARMAMGLVLFIPLA